MGKWLGCAWVCAWLLAGATTVSATPIYLNSREEIAASRAMVFLSIESLRDSLTSNHEESDVDLSVGTFLTRPDGPKRIYFLRSKKVAAVDTTASEDGGETADGHFPEGEQAKKTGSGNDGPAKVVDLSQERGGLNLEKVVLEVNLSRELGLVDIDKVLYQVDLSVDSISGGAEMYFGTVEERLTPVKAVLFSPTITYAQPRLDTVVSSARGGSSSESISVLRMMANTGYSEVVSEVKSKRFTWATIRSIFRWACVVLTAVSMAFAFLARAPEMLFSAIFFISLLGLSYIYMLFA